MRVYEFRFGHSKGYTVHYHIVPVYEWTINAYWQDPRYRCLMQFYGENTNGFEGKSNFDGADMVLFITRTFGEPGVAPPKINAPSVNEVVSTLRTKLA